MHKLSIVIIEDEPIVMAGLCSIINSQCSEWAVVGTADNGHQGLKIVQELKPDIILTDIRMPYLDGLELIKQVRQKDEKVIIIILTGHADFNYAQLAVKYGVLDYILKPSSPKEIISVLERAVSEKARNARITNQDAVLGSEVIEHVKKAGIDNSVEIFMNEADKIGLWSLDVRKAVKIAEKDLIHLIDRLMDDRMISLSHLMELRLHMTGMYKITEIPVFKAFLESFIVKLTGFISFNNNSNILIKKTMDYVNQDITRNVSLKELADKMFLNYSYLSQLFKKETSLNFSEYLVLVRMEKAREMLCDVRLKIYKIANNLGYSSAKHFSNTFKKIYELSPSEYQSLYTD